MTSNKIKRDGKLPLNGLELPCYVLEDGRRIISGRGMQNVLKLSKVEDDKSEEQKPGGELTRFINSKWFNELIISDKNLEHFNPIICYKGHQKINGYEATALVDFCNIILEARKQGKINTARQALIADQCEILVRSFAKVGIIALIDEATGYQYEREKLELQAILQTFISDEILKWQRTFELSFYKEIFRLWNIPFTAENIRKKPMFIGKLTIELVYKNLPKGVFVLEKLKEKTPRTKGGHYRYKLHQSLTPEAGREALKKVITAIETLASISDTKRKFLRLVKEKYGQREIPFEDLDELPETKKVDKKTNMDMMLGAVLMVPPPPKGK